MMKTGELVVIVDSVEDAVKFYTEKLGFDIVELQEDQSNPQMLSFSLVRKSKCEIIFRKPFVEEFAEFSFIKRCMSRCVGITVEMNNGIEKLFDRCEKKGVDIIHQLERYESKGEISFTIKDLFGIKLVFSQPIEGKTIEPDFNFHGYPISKDAIKNLTSDDEEVLINRMIQQLKVFGVSRRAAKKYAKLWLKNLLKAKL